MLNSNMKHVETIFMSVNYIFHDKNYFFRLNFYKIILHIFVLNFILKCVINSYNTLYKLI